MAKSVKSLSGAEKDAYLARVLAGEAPGQEVSGVSRRLASEVTRLWVKVDALTDKAPVAEPAPMGAPIALCEEFDPFSPNVVVVLRRSGRDKALSELGAIRAPDRLKLLAREQQLTIPAQLADAQEIRAAIVAAAERRVANRRAAAS